MLVAREVLLQPVPKELLHAKSQFGSHQGAAALQALAPTATSRPKDAHLWLWLPASQMQGCRTSCLVFISSLCLSA